MMPITTDIKNTQDTSSAYLAVEMWTKLHPDHVEPLQIETLKEREKTTVYRLIGAGLQGKAIIAKRSRRESAKLEHKIYTELFPRLPLPTLEYYGFVPQPDSHYIWLFLEDAGDVVHSLRSADYQRIVTLWMAEMHMAATKIIPLVKLPARGPNYYLEQMRLTRYNIHLNLDNPALADGDRLFLRSLVAQCDMLESTWDQVEKFCKNLPVTLVHGDFVDKNIRFKKDSIRDTLVALDWETAGWGTPAADLQSVDIELYWSLVYREWPHVGLSDIQRLVHYGRLFRLLLASSWESLSLPYAWLDKPLERLRIYYSELALTCDLLCIGKMYDYRS